ncbi:MAG: hypothetical protein C5S47_02875 [Candidatus Methanogasteraceae archaeon]|nr:MAG: hypothetical protein C5S47_02875 [ANME-2 cluster archaeon]
MAPSPSRFLTAFKAASTGPTPMFATTFISPPTIAFTDAVGVMIFPVITETSMRSMNCSFPEISPITDSVMA